MSYRAMVAPLVVLCGVVWVHAAAKSGAIRVKILDSETHSVTIDDSGVPKNCDQVNFDAYCNNSKTTQVTNVLLVQEDDHPPFRVSCAVDARWSRCVSLPKGETFDAKLQKHGILVYYEDDKGKARSQLYTLVAGAMPSTANADQMSAAPPSKPASQTVAPSTAAATAPAPSAAPAVAVPSAPEGSARNVKCDFSSTPAGAEITLDGKYVGSTPSEISVSAGAHVVEFSMPGFMPWKRDLTVTPGSELTVSAILQKQ